MSEKKILEKALLDEFKRIWTEELELHIRDKHSLSGYTVSGIISCSFNAVWDRFTPQKTD